MDQDQLLQAQSSQIQQVQSQPDQTSNVSLHIQEQRIQLLQTKLESCLSEKSGMLQNITSLTSQLQSFQEQNNSLNNQINDIKTEKDILANKHHQDVTNNNNLQERIRKLKNENEELSRGTEEKEERWKVENRELKNKMGEMLREKLTLENDNSESKFKVDTLENKLKNLQKEKDSLNSMYQEQSVKVLRSFGEDLQKNAKIQELNRKIESLERDLHTEKQTFETQLTSNRDTIKQLQQEIQQLRADHNQEKSFTERFRSEKLALQNHISQLEQQFQQSRQDLAQSQSMQSKLEREYSNAKQVLSKLEGEKELYQKKLCEAQEQYQVLTLAKVSEDLKLSLNENQVAQYRQELEKTLRQSKEIPKKVSEVNQTNKQLAIQLENHQKLVKEYNQAIIQMNNQIQNLNKQLKLSDQKHSQSIAKIRGLSESLHERQKYYDELQFSFRCWQDSVKQSDVFGDIKKQYELLIIQRQKDQMMPDESLVSIQDQDKLKEEYLTFRHQNEQLEKRLVFEEETIRNLSTELDRREQQIEQLNNRISQQKQARDSGLRNQSPDQRQDQNEVFKMMQEQNQMMNKQYSENLEKKVSDIAQLRQEISDQQKKNDNLILEKSQMQQQIILGSQKGINREDYEALQQDYQKALQQLSEVKSQLQNTEERCNFAVQRAEIEHSQRIHFEQKIQEYKSLLEKERLQVETLKRNQIEQISSSSFERGLSSDDQFRSLTELIKDLRTEKENLSRQLRGKEIEECQKDTIIHNNHLMLENLKSQLKREQLKSQDLQKHIDFLKQQQQLQPEGLDLSRQKSQIGSSVDIERANQELKQTLIAQKEANEKEISAKDSMIDQLHQCLIECERKLKDQEEQIALSLSRVAEQKDQEVQAMRERIEELERNNTVVSQEREDMNRQIQVFQEEKEKLQTTCEMQDNEIKRIEGLKGESIDRQRFEKIQSDMARVPEKLNELELQQQEQMNNLQVQLRDFQIKEQYQQSEKQQLFNEIETLKEREATLKSQNDILQKHLDQVRAAQVPLLTNISQEMRQSSSAEEQQQLPEKVAELLLKERLLKAEQEVERLRGEWYAINEENKRLKSQLNNLEFKVINHEEEIKGYQQQQAYNSFQLRMMDEVNEQNKQLLNERTTLIEEIERVKELKPREVAIVNPEINQQITDKMAQLEEDLKFFQEQNEQLKREVQRSGQPSGQQVSVGQQSMFRSMYNALMRAKQTLIALIELIGMEGDENEEGDEEIRKILGKRQRKE